MKSFVPGSVHLSSAPRFSEVMSARVVRKPFQRFLQSGCKPLKRFARSLVADTRLKPGADEREAFAVADSFAVRDVAKQVTRVTHEGNEAIGKDDASSFSSSIQESAQVRPPQAGDGTSTPRSALDQPDPGYAFIGGNEESVHPARTNDPRATPLELVWISPGTFLMGSSPHEKSRGRYEGPETSV